MPQETLRDVDRILGSIDSIDTRGEVAIELVRKGQINESLLANILDTHFAKKREDPKKKKSYREEDLFLKEQSEISRIRSSIITELVQSGRTEKPEYLETTIEYLSRSLYNSPYLPQIREEEMAPILKIAEKLGRQRVVDFYVDLIKHSFEPNLELELEYKKLEPDHYPFYFGSSRGRSLTTHKKEMDKFLSKMTKKDPVLTLDVLEKSELFENAVEIAKQIKPERVEELFGKAVLVYLREVITHEKDREYSPRHDYTDVFLERTFEILSEHESLDRTTAINVFKVSFDHGLATLNLHSMDGLIWMADRRLQLADKLDDNIKIEICGQMLNPYFSEKWSYRGLGEETQKKLDPFFDKLTGLYQARLDSLDREIREEDERTKTTKPESSFRKFLTTLWKKPSKITKKEELVNQREKTIDDLVETKVFRYFTDPDKEKRSKYEPIILELEQKYGIGRLARICKNIGPDIRSNIRDYIDTIDELAGFFSDPEKRKTVFKQKFEVYREKNFGNDFYGLENDLLKTLESALDIGLIDEGKGLILAYDAFLKLKRDKERNKFRGLINEGPPENPKERTFYSYEYYHWNIDSLFKLEEVSRKFGLEDYAKRIHEIAVKGRFEKLLSDSSGNIEGLIDEEPLAKIHKMIDTREVRPVYASAVLRPLAGSSDYIIQNCIGKNLVELLAKLKDPSAFSIYEKLRDYEGAANLAAKLGLKDKETTYRALIQPKLAEQPPVLEVEQSPVE